MTLTKNLCEQNIALYTERLNNMKDNRSEEIDSMSDDERHEVDARIADHASFIRVLKTIKDSIPEQEVLDSGHFGSGNPKDYGL